MHNRLSRYNVFKFLAENLEKYIQFDAKSDKSLISAINLIKKLLEGVEEFFGQEYLKLDKKERNRESSRIYDEILVILTENIEKSEEYWSAIKDDLPIMDKLRDLEKFLDKSKMKEKKTWYAVRQLIFHYLKQVIDLSEKIFNIYIEEITNSLVEVKIDYFGDQSRISVISQEVEERAFLSYAYTDKLYTLGIFLMFLENHILLYVDWIFNEKNNNIKKLKNDIDFILSNCNYFIFLRTPNSELSIKGARHIRQWCSWEIGKFYEYAKTEEKSKYIIDSFGTETKNNDLLENFYFFEVIGDIKRKSEDCIIKLAT